MERSATAHSKRINKKLLISGVILLGVLFAAGLFMARGWIRGPLIHWYAESAYMRSINRFFEGDFKDVDPKLAALGLTFDTHYTTYLDKVGGCNEPMYGGFGVSTHCFKTYFNDNPGPAITDTYRERWRQESPALEDYLLSAGWTKTWNAAQPIDDLLTRDDRGQSVGVNYLKKHDKIACTLSIWYNGSEEEQDEFNAQKSCSRSVEFFGGY